MFEQRVSGHRRYRDE